MWRGLRDSHASITILRIDVPVIHCPGTPSRSAQQVRILIVRCHKSMEPDELDKEVLQDVANNEPWHIVCAVSYNSYFHILQLRRSCGSHVLGPPAEPTLRPWSVAGDLRPNGA